MSRSLFMCSMLLMIGLSLRAEDDMESPEEIQAQIEDQFDERDADENGMLDEKEMEGFSPRLLGRMRERGLRQGFPLPRGEFIKAGVAERAAETKKENDQDDMSEAEPTSNVKTLTAEESAELARSAPTSSRRIPSGKSAFFPSLPPEYQARDKNGDGQIALYEWDRALRAEFKKLDKNGDGFVTPAELRQPGSSKGFESRRGSGSESQDPVQKEAVDTFVRMDSDRDGKIGEEEWGRSQRVRPMFDMAGVRVSLPMDQEAFVSNFRRAKESGESNGSRR